MPPGGACTRVDDRPVMKLPEFWFELDANLLDDSTFGSAAAAAAGAAEAAAGAAEAAAGAAPPPPPPPPPSLPHVRDNDDCVLACAAAGRLTDGAVQQGKTNAGP